MIQLKVYNDETKLQQFWLDLYETEPIKLTLSIEDITNAEATSVFSKAFKVPGTRTNAEFFKNSFDVDGILYDVTVKKPAEILVDGAEFRQGHIRLQKIFLNTEQDRYDYELLFLGETRDFSSRIGDKGLCQLDMPELVGNDDGSSLNNAGVQASWQAFPESVSLTAGIHNGNIIYPLIDHGNSYSDTGVVEQTRIAVDISDPNITVSTGNNPLGLDRMKPMIRAKRLVDQIFLDAGYTYTSTFFDSDLFHQIYISAFGNSATVGYEADGDSTSSVNTAYGEDLTQIQSTLQSGTPSINNVLEFPDNQVDAGNNLFNSYYTVPTGSGSYRFTAECFYDAYRENSDYTQTPVSGRLKLWNITQNVLIFQSGLGGQGTLQFDHTQVVTAGVMSQGDKVGIFAEPNSSVDYDVVTNVIFEVVSAPGQYNPSQGLECSYKQVDFIKDILTAFRLVLAPDPSKPDNFIIEPWQTYINSGELYDWSNKLVQNKDVVIEPVFFSQSETIKYDMQPGGDYTNIYHKQAYSENYGYLEFNSGNDLLKGERKVELKGIAPTPITQIDGWALGDNVALPQLHTRSSTDTGTQDLPLKVKTRMLFYNGLQNFININSLGGANNTWYLTNSPNPTALTTYPLVSPYQEWPIAPETLNLNWFNDVQYWQTVVGYNYVGSTLYSDYWSRYIGSLYNKYSRRVTATFILNNIDLNTFSFDDTIFVNGTYYRPEKIIDVQVGAYTEVQVVLITANDFTPSVVLNETLTNFSAVGTNVGCANTDGTITITTDGTPGFTWTLSSGLTGSALTSSPVGQAPYTFNINNVAPGNYTVDVIDIAGRTGSTTVNVPVSGTNNPTATHVITEPTDCTSPCNGSILVTPASGVAPYTIVWTAPVLIGNNLNPTNLCPGSYSYRIVDSNGCESPTYAAPLTCVTTQNIWNYAQDFNCQFLGNTFLKVDVGASTPNPSADVVQLKLITGSNIAGCWRPISVTTGTPTHTIAQVYADCNTCQGIVPGANYWKVQDCLNPTTVIVVKENSANPPNLNDVFNLDGIAGCWTVIGEGQASDWSGYEMTGEYVDCAACAGPVGPRMYSAEAENQGGFNSTCPTTTFPYAIFSPLTTDAALLNVGDTLYSDANFNNPWLGSTAKAKFYSLANQTTLSTAIVSARIDGNGTIVQLNIC
tara:strand:+ start:1727 stop:5218 length:3492 start_codon:yes stop_codon:yes gene_type:complete